MYYFYMLTGSGAVCLSHLDGWKTKECVDHLLQAVTTAGKSDEGRYWICLCFGASHIQSDCVCVCVCVCVSVCLCLSVCLSVSLSLSLSFLFIFLSSLLPSLPLPFLLLSLSPVCSLLHCFLSCSLSLSTFLLSLSFQFFFSC